MAEYIHNTPAILIAAFKTKAQVKNSGYCDLVDDNLPDDLFSLKGAQLEIQEGNNTLNKDFALAIAFNQIRDIETAKQVGRLLVANGPGMDSFTIRYYVTRLRNGPYGSAITQDINQSFYLARSQNTPRVLGQRNLGNNTITENSFVTYLSDKLSQADCFLTPANYFQFGGIYGTLMDRYSSYNKKTSPTADTNNTEYPGVDNGSTFKQLPPPFQLASSVLNIATLGTFKKLTKSIRKNDELKREKELAKENKSLRDENKGLLLTPDFNTVVAYVKAIPNMFTSLAEELGDNFRVNDSTQENAYKYTTDYGADSGNNAQRAATPGVTGIPVGANPGNSDGLKVKGISNGVSFEDVRTNLTLSNKTPQYTGSISPYTTKLNSYSDYIGGVGGANYVSVYVAKNTLYPVNSIINSSQFLDPKTKKPIPLKIADYIENVDPEIATSIPSLKVQLYESEFPLKGNIPTGEITLSYAGSPEAIIDNQGNVQDPTDSCSRSSLNFDNFVSNDSVIPGSVRIDTDGIRPPPFNDPDYQPNTSYLDGSLDANIDNYVVVPIGSTIPLGTRVKLTNTITGKTINAFVGDRGPARNGLGEISLAAARELGVWKEGDGNSARQNQPIRWEFDQTSPKITKRDLIPQAVSVN